MTYNIRLAGVGGQGIITAGNIISEAAMRSGQKVIMSEIHGLSQRGGSVTVDVRIGDYYGPIISESSCDLVIGLELIETFRAIESFENVGTALMNTEKINPISLSMHRKEYPRFEDLMEKYGMGTKIYPVEAGEIAMEAGSSKAVNIVMIGVALGLNLFPMNADEVVYVLKDTFPEKKLDINMKALELGIAWSGRMKTNIRENSTIQNESS